MVQILIIAAYIVVCLGIGFKYYKRNLSFKDYAITDRPFSTPILAATTFASIIDAFYTIGAVEKTHSLSYTYVIPSLAMPINWIIMGVLFSKNLRYLKSKKCISLTDIMSLYYGKMGRLLTCIGTFILTLGIIAINIKAIGYILKYSFGIHEYYGNFFGLLIVMVYSLVGGLKGVIFTDVFQCIIFFVIMPFILAIAYFDLKSSRDAIIHFDAIPANIDFGIFSLLLLYNVFPSTSAPFVQRILMAKDSKQLKNVYFITALLLMIFLPLIYMIGVITKILYPDVSSDIAIFHFINRYWPIGSSLLIVGLLAAIMSTIDSYLNSTGVILTKDINFIKFRFLQNQDKSTLVKFYIIFISILALLISFLKESIIDIIWLIENFWDPLIMVPLFSALLGLRVSNKVYNTIVIVTILSMICLRVYLNEFGIVSLCISIIISFSLILTFSKLNKNNNYFSLMHLFKSCFNNLYNFSIECALRLKRTYTNTGDLVGTKQKYIFVSFIILANIPSLFVYGKDHYIHQDIGVYIRLLASVLCIIIFFLDYSNISSHIKRIYWNCIIIYCLSFIPSYFLIVDNYKILTLLNLFLSVLLIYILFNFSKAFLDFIIGLATASLFILIMKALFPFVVFQENFKFIIYSSFVSIAFISFFIFNKNKINKERLETMESFSSTITHETLAPLARINLKLDLIEDEHRHSVYHDIKDIVNQGIQDVETILCGLKEVSEAADYGEYSIYECIRESFSEYDVFYRRGNSYEIKKVKDFKFYGSKILMKHVFYNLIKNAYHHGGNDALISVRVASNKVEFVDYGKGIDNSSVDSIFKKFYTKSRSGTGTGIGLSLCKEIMNKIGGDIECFSKPGTYTKFILIFN